MILQDIIQKETYGLVEKASEQNRAVINDFGAKCEYPDLGYTPKRIYYEYWHGTDSPMDAVNRSLINDYPITINSGYNHTDTFYTNSAKGVTIGSIVTMHTNKKFIVGKDRFKAYRVDAFREIVRIVIAMTISKYDVSTLFKEHIVFTVFATMFYLFRVFDNNGQYIVDVKDCRTVMKEIFNTDICEFEDVARKYGFERCPSDVRTRKTNNKIKPMCAEDLTRCFLIGMTQTEKKEAIMKWWHCGSSTARNYMKEFGLTDSKYIRSGYKEIHEHIDEAVNEIVDDIKDEMNNTTDRTE